MTDDEPGRRITEAEYQAWMEHRMPQIAAELTEFLPREARDAGICFEFGDVPLRNEGAGITGAGIGEFPEWPYPPWTPMRNVFARWHSGKVCYLLPSGNMVHIKPGCRC